MKESFKELLNEIMDVIKNRLFILISSFVGGFFITDLFGALMDLF